MFRISRSRRHKTTHLRRAAYLFSSSNAVDAVRLRLKAGVVVTGSRALECRPNHDCAAWSVASLVRRSSRWGCQNGRRFYFVLVGYSMVTHAESQISEYAKVE